jgi:TPP-dependent pyruvate/acetoin dehydrogenase alpha subunit
MACGVALDNVAHKNGRVVVVSIGDGALNQGAVHEAMASAALRKFPLVFVVENNGWSELTATSDMTFQRPQFLAWIPSPCAIRLRWLRSKRGKVAGHR